MKKRTSIIVCLVVMLTMLTAFAAACSDKTFKINFYDGDKAYDTVTTGGNEVITLPTSPVKDGYTFAGWFFDDAMTNQLTENTYAELKLKAEVNVYAKWTANDNTIIFDANGGSGTMANFVAKTDSVILLTANAFTKDGYAFAGWATTADGVVAYADGASYTMAVGGATLFAKWTANDNTITFNANGGVGTIANQTIKTGASANLTANAFTKDGYAFAGWATTADGVVAYADGASYTMAVGGATLFAKWTANDNTITFYANFGTTDKSSQTIKTGESATLTLNAFVNAGYTFAGWATTAAGTVVEFADGVNYTMGTASVELFAVWTAKDNTLSFNANGGVGTIASQTIKTGASANLTANTTITRDGYTFAGWATTAGGVVEYADGVNYTMGTASVELFAVWTAFNYTIKFNYDGADSDTTKTEMSATYGAAFLCPAPTKTGYVFQGWYDGATQYTDNLGASVAPLTGANNAVYKVTAMWVGSTDGMTFTDDGTNATLTKYKGTAKYIAIPETYNNKPVTTIAMQAFYGTQTLKSIVIPNSITTIGKYAFQSCTNLTSITIPASVTSISHAAIIGCQAIESIFVDASNTAYSAEGNCLVENATKYLILGRKNSVIPADVKTIGEAAFDSCTEMTTMTIPASVETIDRIAFWQCTSLATLTIESQSKLKTIGDRAFYECLALKAFTIPASVTSISGYGSYQPFLNANIETFTVESGNTKYKVTGNCLIEIDTKTVIAGCKDSVIPTDDSVTQIGNGAFSGCKGLTEIVISGNVKTIGSEAFGTCRNLVSVTLSEGLTTIGQSAFNNCVSLTSITIPASVTTMGGNVFQICTAITKITCLGKASKPAGWADTWLGNTDPAKVEFKQA